MNRATLRSGRYQRQEPARSIILIWLAGGPSQLETFDPHPGTAIAGGTRAIATAVKGMQLAEGFGHLAESMGEVALVRYSAERLLDVYLALYERALARA